MVTAGTNWTELCPHFVSMMAASVTNSQWWSMKQEVTSVFRVLSDYGVCPSEDICVLHFLLNTYAIYENYGLRWGHSCCLRIGRGLRGADPPVIRTDVTVGQLSVCLTVVCCNKHDIFHLGDLQTQRQLLSTPQLQGSPRPYFCACTSCRDKSNV